MSMVIGDGYRVDQCEDTTELEALREDEADVIVAHADGQMTSQDYAECIALAVATGWRPRCLRTKTRMTDAERAAPTLPPQIGEADLAQRKDALRDQAHGGEIACDVDWEDGQ